MYPRGLPRPSGSAVAPGPITTVDRIVDAVPEVVDKVTEFIEKQQEKKAQEDELG